MSSCPVTILCHVFLPWPLTFCSGDGLHKTSTLQIQITVWLFGGSYSPAATVKSHHVPSSVTQSTAPLPLKLPENASQNNCTECIVDAFMLVSCSLNANTTLLAEFLLQLCHHVLDSFTNHSFRWAGCQSLMHILNCASSPEPTAARVWVPSQGEEAEEGKEQWWRSKGELLQM